MYQRMYQRIYLTIKIDLLLISAIINVRTLILLLLAYQNHYFAINSCYNLACTSIDGVEIIEGNAST